MTALYTARRRVRRWKRRTARRWARMPARRRRAVLPAAGLSLALVLGGANACSPFRSTDGAAPAALTSTQPLHHAVEDRAFPITVTHRYGETELSDPPARIVTLGVHDQDLLISLGVRPVGIRDWPGTDRTYASLPWTPQDLRPGELPVASPVDEFDFAAVAALKPDLITVINSDLTEPEYHRLTEIAPTIAQVPDTSDFLASWQEETRLMARAVGRPRQGEAVIADLERSIAAVREQHPVLSDTRVALVTYDRDRRLRLVNPYDPRARLLASIGMRFPDSVATASGASEYDVETDLDVLAAMEEDFDLFVWTADPALDPQEAAAAAAQMRADQDYTDIDPVRRGASVFLSAPEALAFASGLSLAYAAERDGPALAEALGQKAEADRGGVTPGPLPRQDPDLDRDRAEQFPQQSAEQSAGSAGQSAEQAAEQAAGQAVGADPAGTPTPAPAGEPAPTFGPPASGVPYVTPTPTAEPDLVTLQPGILPGDPGPRPDTKVQKRRSRPDRAVRDRS